MYRLPLPLLCVAPTLAFPCLPPLPGDLYVDASNPSCATADGTQAAPFCTVAAAVAVALSGDTIHIAPGVYFENLVLGLPLTLVGTAGAASTILDGNGTDRVFVVQSTSTAVLDGLTIRNGLGVSGGGGVFNTGDLSLLNSVVTDNVVTPSGTGFQLSAGAGIFSDGNLTLDGTTVANNTSRVLPVNQAYSMVGAGIMSRSFGAGTTTVLRNSTIVDNQHDASAGGYAYSFGVGLAVVCYASYSTAPPSLEMTDCTVRGNSTSPEALGSTGTAVYLGTTNAILTSSTIAENSFLTLNGGYGGVVSYHGAAFPTSVALSNCTVSDNFGSGVLTFGYGAGPLTIEHCTISGNTGRGIVNFGNPSPQTVQVANSIVAGNTHPDPLAEQDLSGDFVSLGHNLIGEAGAGVAGFVDGVLGDQVGAHVAPLTPGLLPLADNGGPTWTHALEPTSPAIDAADPLSTVLFDQRGVPRPAGAADVGAFELAAGVGLGAHVCDGVPNSTGAGATLAMQGSASLSANDLELTVASLPQQSLGYFLTSRNVFTLVNPGGAQGNLCIASLQMGRYAGQVLNSGASGSVSMPVDLTAIPLAGVFLAAQPNETWYWQYWYRDMNPASTSNFSAARGLTVQ